MNNKLLNTILLLLFPHKCFYCGKVLADEGYVCEQCVSIIPHTGEELCPICGKQEEDCLCQQAPTAYDGCTSALFYTREVAYGIHRYKYEGKSYYADYLAKLMAEKFSLRYGDTPIDLITYVPMHKTKRKQRGFCQTKLLADRLAQKLEILLDDSILVNTGRGNVQMEQHSLKARQENVKISFKLAKGASVSEKAVLLVDDVLTTGSTLNRCAALLKKAGAREVYCITAAVTRKKEKKAAGSGEC